MSNTIVENIKSIPPVTRFFTIASIFACLIMSTLGTQASFHRLFINYYTIIYDYDTIIRPVLSNANAKYYQIVYAVLEFAAQVYKFGTSLFIPAGINDSTNRIQAIFDIYFFYTFSNHLEGYEGKFKGNFPDYLWYIIICGTLTHIITIIYTVFYTEIFFPHEILLGCVTYTWSRCFKNATINLLGIVPIKAYYLPLGNLFVKLILSGPHAMISTLMGIVVGYLYLCIQSNTLPIYNLFPGAYGTPGPNKKREGSRLGVTHIDQPTRGSTYDFIGDSIYDKGYLKAPEVLYKWLSYPVESSFRSTAFTDFKGNTLNGRATDATVRRASAAQEVASGSSSGYSWFGNNGTSGASFKGKGHRLGG
ncbi:uncharacterized protein SPAPADRAFT_59048 [Spathaspora passalidarum NRRL Y-27907]|uniref:Derlin n=1 Tax=Spathaspora passalidarum (strain NRRL Y-27907 / 11-Y1) TaxID=619300 RepID=G3AIB0_SPAPN|nr:uncharacterized protein SPAPADRAFT_59048 [Spathaspora passalidarum NRRL Y-27907]EGW33679.1 hypothetical protein SPAPADRAFT_59048 [Spathaspora passalidarum NRRL Y-27907]